MEPLQRIYLREEESGEGLRLQAFQPAPGVFLILGVSSVFSLCFICVSCVKLSLTVIVQIEILLLVLIKIYL